MNRFLTVLTVASIGMFPLVSLGDGTNDGGSDHAEHCHPNGMKSYTEACHPGEKPPTVVKKKKSDDNDEWVIAAGVVGVGVVGWLAYEMAADADLLGFLPQNLQLVPQLEEDGSTGMLIEYSLDASNSFGLRAHTSWNDEKASTLNAYWRFSF